MTQVVESVATPSWVLFFRRHERRLAALWLVFTFCCVAGTLVRPVRVRVLTTMASLVDRWDGRWNRRLAAGVALYQRGDYEGAVTYLSRLDRIFPARSNRHGRDKEREYLLRLLALSYEKSGRTTRAMATWERLVAFDSLNYENHFGYAQAAERLLSGWALAEEARNGYAATLGTYPAHLPAVRGYIDYYMDRGEFQPVVAAWEAYLDAFFPQRVTVTLGDTAISVLVPTDGRAHDVEVAFARPVDGADSLRIRTGGFPIALDSAAVLTASRVGTPGGRARHSLDVGATVAPDMARDTIAWLPNDTTAALTLPVASIEGPITRVQLRVRLFKPADAALWGIVAKSYRNLLAWPALAASRERTAVFASDDAADRLYASPRWLPPGLPPDAP
ncbi:MAG: hypothetical protein IPF87_21020 [Gemmatimonadetes bacterium]|nr:hypothetical protein [Gemmatimonadota bacterium]